MMSISGKENYEVFITLAVCSTLAEHTQMQIGGTYARGSNAENNRSCNLVLMLVMRQKPVDVTHNISYYAKASRSTGEPDGKRYQ